MPKSNTAVGAARDQQSSAGVVPEVSRKVDEPGGWFYNAIPYLMVALGLAYIVLGSKVYSQRVLAVRIAIGLQGLDMLAMGMWLLLMLDSGMVSVLMMLLPAASLSGALLCAFAHPSCVQTEKARRRATAAGLDIDL